MLSTFPFPAVIMFAGIHTTPTSLFLAPLVGWNVQRSRGGVEGGSAGLGRGIYMQIISKFPHGSLHPFFCWGFYKHCHRYFQFHSLLVPPTEGLGYNFVYLEPSFFGTRETKRQTPLVGQCLLGPGSNNVFVFHRLGSRGPRIPHSQLNCSKLWQWSRIWSGPVSWLRAWRQSLDVRYVP